MIDARALRHRVVIEARTDAQDTFGEADPSWATLATVSAEVEPLQGREVMGSGLELDETPHRFRFRYGTTWAALNPQTHRITFASKTFDIVSVNHTTHGNREFVCIGVVRG